MTWALTPAAFPSLSEEQPLREEASLSPAAHVAILLIATGLLLTRRPDAFFNPQFWAEDGGIWFAQAHALGPWVPFRIPNTGYLQTISRLVAAISVLFPLRWAPTVFNFSALLIQLAPLSLLLTQRASILGRLPARLFFGLLYVCLPNSFEIHMNVTNAQWHLAFLYFLVLILPPWDGLWRVFDWAVIVIAGLSGPFSFFLVPVAWLLWRGKRLRPSRALAVAGCAAVQVAAFLFMGGTPRDHGPMGASIGAFSRIIGGQVVIGSLIGQQGLEHLNAHAHLARYVFFALTIAAFGAFCVTVLRGSLEHKAFVVFAALILAATLRASNGSGAAPAWPSLGNPGMSCRYWFIPMLACLVTLAWLAGGRHPLAIRIPAVALLLIFPVGVVLDWRYRPFEDFHWREHAALVEASAPGTPFEIPINPPGWKVGLTAPSHRDRP